MVAPSDTKLAALETFLRDHPHITYVTPASPNYAAERAGYIIDNPARPLAIARPQSAEDVSLLVKYATSHGIQFAVRSGGNNLFGLSQAHDGLTIDMRDISYVNIDESKAFAKIGGGVLFGKLAEHLTKANLATAMGTMPFIGYAGWSIYGGYGPFSPKYGIGADNIIGAKVVNAKGEIVDADKGMLKGIRGAGGAFGVIVEFTIKVYPLKSILTGAVFLDTTDISAAVQKFNVGYESLSAEGLPAALSLQPVAMNGPHGRAFAVIFMWCSEDEATGREYLDKVTALGTPVVNTVAISTIHEWLQGLASLVPSSAYGSTGTISVRELSPEVTAIMGRNLEKMPSHSGCGFSIHQLRKPIEEVHIDSVFGSREPHFMIEFIWTPATEAGVKECREWADSFRQDLLQSDPKNILPGTYISLTSPGSNTLANIYGPNYETLMALRRKYDPERVFNLAVPFVYEK